LALGLPRILFGCDLIDPLRISFSSNSEAFSSKLGFGLVEIISADYLSKVLDL